MRTSMLRARRASVALCLGTALLGITTLDTNAQSADSRLAIRAGRFPVYAYSPNTYESARPITIYLHGMCGEPSHGCGNFRDGVSQTSWLLCPSARTACDGGGAIWSGSTAQRAAVVDDAERELVAAYGDAVDVTQGRVLIGFSQGAYLARDLLRKQPLRYRGVMFIGANVQPTADALREAGVRRAVFASGRYDMMRKPLEQAAEALVKEGYPARFVDLGAVGHTYVPARDEPVLRDALAWLEEES